MKFTCNTTELKNALTIAGRALSARPVLKAYESVLLNANDDGLIVTASDGTIRMNVSVYASVDEPGEMALDGKLIGECVRKMNSAETTIETKGNTAIIRSGKCKTQMAVQDAENYPAQAKGKGKEVTVSIPGKPLKECIEYVQFAVSNDESRKILTGVLVEIADGKLLTVGLDGFRLAKREVECGYDGEPIRVVLPKTGALELARLLTDDGEAELTLDDISLTANVDNCRLTMATLTGEYIDYKRIIPNDSTTIAKISADELRACCERAQLMAKHGKNNLIRLDFHENYVGLSSNADVGDVYDEADCDLQGDGLRIAFNDKYLMDALKAESGNEIEIAMKSNVSACAIRNLGDEGTLQLLLPVRELK